MRISLTALALLPILAACSKPAPPVAPAASASAHVQAASASLPVAAKPLLSPNGFGAVRFGTSLSAVEQQLGAKADQLGENDPACSSVRIKAVPGVRFMVEKGIVTRADADTGTPNSLGLAVGDTLALAKTQYPSIEVGPHKYLPAGHYLTFKSADGAAAIIMEEDGKAITKIRAGLQPAVAYVEVCL